MLAAIILAAGDSTRMGRPKALLPDPEGRPFVARLVRTFASAGVRDVIVVTGSLHAAIADALAGDQLPIVPILVNNPQPALGQLSSLWIGLDAAETLASPQPHSSEKPASLKPRNGEQPASPKPRSGEQPASPQPRSGGQPASPQPRSGGGGGVDGVLMTLVDIPLVRVSTIQKVIDEWTGSRAPIVRPAVGDRHGHPVLFDQAVFDALRHAPITEGAKAVVHANANRIVNVQVEDEGCLLDVDTPADYEAVIRKT